MKKVLLGIGLSLLLTSCYTNRHTVGDGPIRSESKVKYSKSKDIYLFWGFAQIGQASPRVPKTGNYMIRSRFSLGDLIIGGLTLGILETRSVKVFVNPEDETVKK